MCQTNSLADIDATIVQIDKLNYDVSIITLECAAIASVAKPGNFVNIKVNDGTQPLLRRPFSIHNVRGSLLEVMVKSVGRGTALFCNTTPGSTVKVLGPLGNHFDFTSKPFQTAVLVSGGIGAAPMLFLENEVSAYGKEVINLTGGRTKNDLLNHNLAHCLCATDDGSAGFKGTVVELLRQELPELKKKGALKVFACGPNPMLKALAHFCHEQQLQCDLSLESVMGCGIGICYGCSIEAKSPDGRAKTILLCKDGPVINSEFFAN